MRGEFGQIVDRPRTNRDRNGGVFFKGPFQFRDETMFCVQIRCLKNKGLQHRNRRGFEGIGNNLAGGAEGIGVRNNDGLLRTELAMKRAGRVSRNTRADFQAPRLSRRTQGFAQCWCCCG